MATVKLTPTEGKDFQLPCQCLYCATSCDLRPKTLTLYKSMPAQFLAIVPFLAIGSAAKEGLGGILVCFALSGLALWAGQLKVVLKAYVCRSCHGRDARAMALSFLATAAGVGLIVGGIAWQSGFLSAVGAGLAFGSPILLWLATRRGDVTLVSRRGQEVTLKVSDHLPLVWSASDPTL